MMTAVEQRAPETKTTPGLGDFLQRQRDVTVPEAKVLPEADHGKEKPMDSDPTKTGKSAEQLKKELDGQARANLRLGAERAELQRKLDAQQKELDEMKAKVAGTFVEPTEAQKQQAAVLKEEFAKFEQRRDASREDAIKEYGEESVLASIYVDDAPWHALSKEKPWLMQRVFTSEHPVKEAMAIMAEEALLTKFGRTEATLMKKAEEILRPILWEQFKTEHTQDDGGVKPPPVVPSLTRAKTAGADSRTGLHEPVKTFSALDLNPHNRV